MGQDKARPAGNSSSIFKGCNAVLIHLWGCAAALRSFELALASPALARLAAQPHSVAEMQRIYVSGY